MVKGKKATGKKAKARAKPKSMVVSVPKPMVVRPPVTRGWSDYQRMLLDPCNCTLTASPYGGDSAGSIKRGHNVINNTIDGQLFVFHPIFGVAYTTVAAGTAGSLSFVNTSPLGSTFTSRALAECVEVMYSGPENSRAGMVHCGIIPGSLVWEYTITGHGGAGVTFDVANVASYLPNVERMPVDKCSVNWFPGNGDGAWIPPITLSSANQNTIQRLFADTHFCVVFITTGPGVNSVRMSYTSIYEYANTDTSVTGSGFVTGPWLVSPASTKAVDVKEAVRELTLRDPKWYLNAFKKVAKFGIGIAEAGLTAGLPGALGYLTSAIAGTTEYAWKRSQRGS